MARLQHQEYPPRRAIFTVGLVPMYISRAGQLAEAASPVWNSELGAAVYVLRQARTVPARRQRITRCPCREGTIGLQAQYVAAFPSQRTASLRWVIAQRFQFSVQWGSGRLLAKCPAARAAPDWNDAALSAGMAGAWPSRARLSEAQ